jgi:Asp-tRNA(Asn)/Glu-tRNA(Gln) amidotransferase A subunit family amidase
MKPAAALVLCFSLITAAHTASAQLEVAEASIEELQRAMSERRTTSAQLVEAYLARIAAYDVEDTGGGPGLNAIIRLNPQARVEAAALDAERARGTIRGPLHGIPIILKDNFDTRGWATSAGLLAMATHVPSQDAFIVQRLRAAGAVIIAKSNMHELAAGITTISSLGGQTRNAYDPTRCPGGSSGGTGTAIAASFAAVGWGTDTCGSIRIPAAYGSLFGLRPTQGLASRSGIVPLALTQDIAGPLARTVTDLAIALDVTVGPDPSDPATSVLSGRTLPRFRESLSRDALRGVRLGLFLPYFRNADADVADTVRAAARAMRALGAEVIDVPFVEFDSLIAGSAVILLETKHDLQDYLARTPTAPVKSLSDIIRSGLFHAALEGRHRIGDTVSARDSESRRRVLAKQAVVRARIIALMDSLRLDALVYPTMTRRPTLIGEPQAGTTCALAAQSGLPAISMPAGFTTDELPVGIELLGKPFSDARLVSFAYAFEQSGPRRRVPPSAPPLVNGRQPEPPTMDVRLEAGDMSLLGTVTFDAMRGELAYSLRLSGTAVTRMDALVLRRVDSVSVGRVVLRLAGPAMTMAVGRVRLSAPDRAALREGRLVLSLFTDRGLRPAAETTLVISSGG